MLKKMRKKAQNKKGFTLVELIVVIVIILILAAVLVPSLLKYVDKAGKANCKSDAATILTQLQADYAAAQAGETDVTDPTGTGYTVNGIPVKIDTAVAKGTAVFSLNDKKTEIASFSFMSTNGKYTATWTPNNSATGTDANNSGWTVTKNN